MDRTRRPRRWRALPLGAAAILLVAACSTGGGATSAPTTAPTSPPSAAASAVAPVSSGTFHGVDGTATGSVALFHKPDGSFVVTFEDLSIASNAHTNVIFVMNKDVTADGDVDKTAFVDLGPLTGTTGMQDYVVPASADAMTFHTVVLWDTEMAHAIAAAPLQ
jgi:Electron transfer DM13